MLDAFISGAGGPGLNLGPVKSDTVLPTARPRCDISSKDAVLPGAMTRKWALKTRYRLRRNTASRMKTFNCYLKADLETFYQISLTLAQ